MFVHIAFRQLVRYYISALSHLCVPLNWTRQIRLIMTSSKNHYSEILPLELLDSCIVEV